MTLATAVRPVSAGTGPAARVRFGRLLLAEWTKLRSVRSTIWSLLLLCVLTLGLTALYTALTVSQWDQAGAFHHAQTAADPTGLIVGGGLALSQLTVCVLGVLVMASEYSTGAIRASLLAVPTRTPMLLAKSVVFALLIFVVGEAVAFSSFFLGASILHAKAPVAIGDPGVARAVAGAGLVSVGTGPVRPRSRCPPAAHRRSSHRCDRFGAGALAARPAAARQSREARRRLPAL